MTGFARSQRSQGAWRLSWEIKSVNAKGLDLRLRTPPGFDAMEQEARTRIARKLTRGACYATLTAQRESSAPEIRLNVAALASLQDAISALPQRSGMQSASLDGLLSIKGIVEIIESADSDETMAQVHAAALDALDEAVDGLVAMRAVEGKSLHAVLFQRLEAIAQLTQAADACPGRKPEAVRARLEQSVAALAQTSGALDPARLHQEAILLAAKADIREELDRLKAHVAATRDLLASGKPVGRRLDFLAQEFGRESNTLCAKSNDPELTRIGMELRVEVEQFREQVQNVE
jgi:uncharacterized protein (TIGR00255 family)